METQEVDTGVPWSELQVLMEVRLLTAVATNSQILSAALMFMLAL